MKHVFHFSILIAGEGSFVIKCLISVPCLPKSAEMSFLCYLIMQEFFLSPQ